MILIIDDDYEYAQSLGKLLTNSGVGTATHAVHLGKAALEWIRENEATEAVVIDMMIPFDDDDYLGGRAPADQREMPHGVRLIEELFGMGIPPARTIVITALYRKPLLDKLQELGVPKENIILKPASTDTIVQRVRQASKSS